jgi:hypothetical protein
MTTNLPTRIEAAIAAKATTYHQALDLVQEVEAHIVGEKAHKGRWLGPVQRVIWLPTMFVAVGVKHKLKLVISWAILSAAFLLAKSVLLSAGFPIDPVLREGLDWACILCPLLLVMFPMPSVYVASGVSPEDVGFAIQRMDDSGIDSKEKVLAAQQTLKMFEERCKRRVVSLTWLVGLAWASWTYFFVKGLEAMIAGHPAAAPANPIVSAIALYGVLAVYLVVTGYESALDRLFRTIDIACGEISLQIESAGADQTASDHLVPTGSPLDESQHSG